MIEVNVYSTSWLTDDVALVRTRGINVKNIQDIYIYFFLTKWIGELGN